MLNLPIPPSLCFNKPDLLLDNTPLSRVSGGWEIAPPKTKKAPGTRLGVNEPHPALTMAFLACSLEYKDSNIGDSQTNDDVGIRHTHQYLLSTYCMPCTILDCG